MHINVTGQHVEITAPLHHYVDAKFAKLQRFFARITHTHVVLKVEKTQHIAEATLHANGEELHATAEQSNMYAAIDLLVDKLVRQLTKYKNRLNHH